MALNHTIIKTRQEGARWLTKLRVVDSDTGKQYIRYFQSKVVPDQDLLDDFGTLAESRIQAGIDFERAERGYEANVLNEGTGLDEVREDLRLLMLDIVRRIRAFPDASLQQAQNYLDPRYPEYSVLFPVLYAKWKKKIEVTTWADFKAFINDPENTFRGID